MWQTDDNDDDVIDIAAAAMVHVAVSTSSTIGVGGLVYYELNQNYYLHSTSLILSQSGGIPKSLGKRIAVDLQLGDLET